MLKNWLGQKCCQLQWREENCDFWGDFLRKQSSGDPKADWSRDYCPNFPQLTAYEEVHSQCFAYVGWTTDLHQEKSCGQSYKALYDCNLRLKSCTD